MNMFESNFLGGGDFVSGDLIRLFESTVCQIFLLSEKSSGDLLLDCDILILTRINSDIGLLIGFVAVLLVLDVRFITKANKVSYVGGLGWITTANGW